MFIIPYDRASLYTVYVVLISHELRTPIGVVEVGLRLLDLNIAALPLDESSTNALELVKEVRASSKRCINVLDDLMTFDEIGSPNNKLLLVQQAIVPFLRDIAGQFTIQAAVSGVMLSCRYCTKWMPE